MTSLPVSELIRNKGIDSDGASAGSEPLTKSREEWRKAKELEEARKAGTAPAAVDEEGRDINPHIPQYISSAPWYIGTSGPTLKHQREPDEHKKTFDPLDVRYLRGAERLVPKVVTKYRKGACENCGAMTHIRKDCLERPRKVGAKYSGSNIAPDELPQPDINFSFDGKRDRWNGYDPNDYLAVVDEFQKVEEAKRHLKAEKLSTGTGGIDLPDNMVLDEDVPEEDEDKYVDDVDMPGTKVDSKQRITVRNLRIREDVAKYLRNLDPNSAYYDPKTRSMRDNPYKDTGKPAEEVDYAGENFVRFTGDTNKHAQAQMFAWEAHERGVDVHALAEPTKLELLKKAFETKKDEFKGSLTKNVLDKYGGQEHLDAPPKTLLLAQTEDYTEYSRQGKIIKGKEKPIIRSKYEEDVYPTNHSSIFGSYWRDGNWGYHCCHSLIKNSYCTGQTGRSVNDNVPLLTTIQSQAESHQREEKEIEEANIAREREEDLANDAELSAMAPSRHPPPESSSKMSKNQKKNQKRKARMKGRGASKKRQSSSSSSSSSSSDSSSSSSDSSSSSSSSDEEDEDVKKRRELKKALEAETRRIKEAEQLSDDRKRKYNSRYEEKQLTEAEVEAYHMMRTREEDPMLQFLTKKPKK